MEWRSAEVVRRRKERKKRAAGTAYERGRKWCARGVEMRAARGSGSRAREQMLRVRRGTGVRVSVSPACGVEMRAEKENSAAPVPCIQLAAEEPFRSGKTAGNSDRMSAFNSARFVFVGEPREKREMHTLFF